MKLNEGQTVTGEKGKKMKVRNKIGEGGFGLVFLGEYNEGTKCVIKQANIWDKAGGMSSNRDIIEKKLKIERKVLERIGNHSQIPTLIDYDERVTPPYLATSFIEGKTFYEKLKVSENKYKPFTEKQAKLYTLKLLNAVEYLQSLNKPVVHRDIKPENVLVRSRHLSLIDFGSSVAGWDGLDITGKTRIFTAGYGAPEQERGRKEVDIRTDIYGVGTTLFFLLTGKDLRFEDRCYYSPYDLKPPSEFNPSLSKKMDDLVMKATEIFPEDRYQSATEMKKALKGEIVGAPKRPMLQLGGVGHSLNIKPGDSIKIGRVKGLTNAKKEKDISLGSRYVSDIHAKIKRDSSGYWVKDMYSLNGTAVYLKSQGKWKQLERGQEWKLYNGDKIALGYDENKGPCIELLFREPS